LEVRRGAHDGGPRAPAGVARALPVTGRLPASDNT
jgi:hypothetical protein